MPEKRLTPFDADEDKEIDYGKLMKEFGTQPVPSHIIKKLSDIRAFRHGYVFSHRDFDKFLAAYEAGKKVAIITGFNASGSIHLGHKLSFDCVIELQKKYRIPAYVPISDDESYVCEKVKDQAEGLKNARLIVAQLLALGFDPSLTKFFIHQQYTKIYNLAIKLSRRYTMSAIKAIYGFTDSTNPGLMFYPVIQAADILLPQEPEFEGRIFTVTPIGIDQDPHMRLARDIADKFGYIKPTTFHIKYLPGLRGGKMSKSRPGSALFLNEKPEVAAKYVMNTLTGGRNTIEEQRKLGGEYDNCIVAKYMAAHFDDDKQMLDRKRKCLSGQLLCGECKNDLSCAIKKFLVEFQARVAKVEKRLDKNLIKN
ncbi:MAG: tryptophan--tRNA ligase [Candidatus Aenigmatarchaeota archaeon]